jgi:hypothetical protein
MASLTDRSVRSALIVGAGYMGVEMSEALVARGIATTVAQRPTEVLAIVDPELGALVRAELAAHGVEVLTGTSVTALVCTTDARIAATATGGRLDGAFDLVVIVAGVRPGCGDACPIVPGKRYLDWALEDPAGRGVAAVRPIPDEIEGRIRGLLAELGTSKPGTPTGPAGGRVPGRF